MKAVVYVRVSTDEQAREGYSLAAQEDAARSYCRALGWEFVGAYDDAGKSGKTMRGRAALAQMLADAEAGLFDRVIFTMLDRIGRNLRNILEISDRLEAAGVGMVSLKENIDTGTASGRMMRNIIGSLAEFERERIVERIVMGVTQKAKEGKVVGPVSVGYRRDDTGYLVPTAAALIVREAFERYATGAYSLRDIARWVTAAGLKGARGQVYDRMAIRKVLTNEVYIGDVVLHKRDGGGVVASDAHPAIVTRELFAQVRHELTRRQTGTAAPWGNREPYPLTGVAVCASCHQPLSGSRANRVQRRYMRCSTSARRGRLACSQPMVKADELEAQVCTYVANMKLPVEYLQAVAIELRQRHRGENHGREIAELQRQVERHRRLFVLGEIDEARYRRDTAPLHRQIEELDRVVQPLDMERAQILLRSVNTIWANGQRSTQRDFVTRVFDRIVVDGHDVVAIQPKAEYLPLFRIDRDIRFAGDLGVVWLPGKDSNLRHAD